MKIYEDIYEDIWGGVYQTDLNLSKHKPTATRQMKKSNGSICVNAAAFHDRSEKLYYRASLFDSTVGHSSLC